MQRVLDEFIGFIESRGLVSAGALKDHFGFDSAALSRLTFLAGPKVIRVGHGRRTAYAIRRVVDGSYAPLPIFRIDRTGRSVDLGLISLASPKGSHLDLHYCPSGFDWPHPVSCKSARDGWYDGFPYFFLDAARWDGAGLAATPFAGDPDVDPPGDFLVGDATHDLWRRQPAPRGICEHELLPHYDRLAGQLELSSRRSIDCRAGMGSYSAVRNRQDDQAHVVVKFARNENRSNVVPGSSRLICEQIALSHVDRFEGVAAAKHRILQSERFTFLEVERADRHGVSGRSGFCSWPSAASLCDGSDRGWLNLIRFWKREELISAATELALQQVALFGQMLGSPSIFNSSLGFVPKAGHLSLAPLTGILPDGELSSVWLASSGGLRPEVGCPEGVSPIAWGAAMDAAMAFWADVAGDTRLPGGLRDVAFSRLQNK